MPCIQGTCRITYLINAHGIPPLPSPPLPSPLTGTNAVYFAAQEGKLDCLKYFLDVLHADAACKDNEGLTLLHAATQGEHLDMVKVSCSCERDSTEHIC